jgi:hypothetical protein
VGAQHQSRQSGSLTLTIQPQIQLEEQGEDVVLKIRLAPGSNAKLWADASCGLPTESAATYSASGTYSVPVQNLAPQNQAYACSLSSDGVLKASIPLGN